MPSLRHRTLRAVALALLLSLVTVAPASAAASRATQQPEVIDLLVFVDDSITTFWAERFDASGLSYTRPSTYLVGEPLAHSCGGDVATAADAPFYCPVDQAVVMTEQALALAVDSSATISQDGDFAVAYIMAHEHAHHVQTLLGTYDSVSERAQAGESLTELSRAFELQADCLAGVWANAVYRQGFVEPGDIEEAQTLAVWLGDDRLAPANPELWDHGTSQERLDWFGYGLETGEPGNCDTGV